MKFNHIGLSISTLLVTNLVSFQSCFAQQHLDLLKRPKEIELLEGIGNLHHPVTTQNGEAQKYFDQGLTLTYAFNHDAAFKSFQKAAKLDPKMAMAYWGMALTLGSNINIPVNAAKEKEAFGYIQKAIQLMPQATDNEQAYINALSKRYSDDPNFDEKKLDIEYNKAMKEAVNKYPDDLDLATLYAESGLDLSPWGQWTSEGKPLPGTMELVAILESVILRDPNHLGANHYYVHTVEASDHPQWALSSAKKLPQLAPSLGHIVHMPSHIYILLGDYDKAAKVNERAIEADKAYVKEYGVEEVYPGHYLSHNLGFLSRAYAMAGNYKGAKKAGDELANFYTPFFDRMPDLEYYYSVPTFVFLRFHKWKDIIDLPPPPNPKMAVSSTVWHFARAYAYASLGDIQHAEEEQKLFLKDWKQLPADSKFGSNSTDKIFKISDDYLNAKLADKKGELKSEIQYLRDAITVQDSLKYSEPPDWFYPIRESLGGALYRDKQYDAAEKEFRMDLNKHPRNGRSLFGLLETLKAQTRTSDAYWVEKQYQTAWKNADTELNIQDL
ncbi:MAG: hypothetical protein H0W88_06270 [Parachlamydiaceae bacterium]|nr:hypothetical protein [Parachlamydiaceae bacterium]